MNERSKKNTKLLNAYEVSDYLRIPLGTVYRLTYQGKIKAVKIGKHWRYTREDIERCLSRGTDSSGTPARRKDNFSERRAYPRINSNFSAWCSIDLPPFKQINGYGIIKNISAGGVFLADNNMGAGGAAEGDPVNIRIGDFNGKELEVKGRVTRKAIKGLGIKFRNMHPANLNRIAEYVG